MEKVRFHTNKTAFLHERLVRLARGVKKADSVFHNKSMVAEKSVRISIDRAD